MATEIVFIGTSDAFGAGGRRQAAILARAAQGAVLLDCAPTTGSGMAALGLERAEVDAVLVTHFHADHFGGIPQLLLASVHEDRRRHPLRLAGPPGIESRVRAACAALGHPLDEIDLGFEIVFHELPAGMPKEVGPVRARSFEARHSPGSAPHGLEVAAGADLIAYTGDTGWFETLPAAVAGAHLFICECTTYAAQAFPYHLSYEEIAARRGAFDCGRMILTHLGTSMAERRGACEIETADDGLRLTL